MRRIGRFQRAIAVLIAAGALGGGIYQATKGTNAAQFSGTFDCYGSTPSCAGLSPASCSDTIGSGLQTELDNATGGEVICLSSTSSYGDIALTAKAYSSVVTVQPSSGVAAVVGTVTLNNADNIRFTGAGASSLASTSLAVNGVALDPSSGCSTNVEFDHVSMSAGGATTLNPTYACSSSLAWTFDHDRFDDVWTSGNHEEQRFRIVDTGGPDATNGITVSNSHFAGGCSDGLDMAGSPYGTVIGPGNEFTDIDQAYADANCSGAHLDPIQGLGSSHTLVTGNWFHDNGSGSGGILSAFEPNITITNNAFQSTGYPHSVYIKAASDATITHNSMAGDVDFPNGDSGETGSGNLVRDNVTSGVTNEGGGTTYTADHNVGVDIAGPAVYVASPASGYYHYQLDPSSPGYHAASDGKSVGITP